MNTTTHKINIIKFPTEQCECDCQFSSEEAFYEWFYEKYPHKSGGAWEWAQKKKNKHYWGFRNSDGEYGVFNTNAPCCGWCKEDESEE